MTKGRNLAVGSAFGLSSQGATFLLQFAYSAVTSRIIDPAGFGAYGVALGASGLFAMFATAGIGQATMLLKEDSTRHIRALSGLALLTGLVAAGALLLFAGLWADLWGTPNAVAPTQVIAAFVLAAPQSVVISGLARRRGVFKLLAVATVTANLLGMGVGVVCALQFRSSTALVVSPIMAQVLIPVFIQIGIRRFYLPSFDLKLFKDLSPFVAKVLVFGVLAYTGRNVPRIAVSRVLGSSVYGNWNRSDVLTSMPLQTVETAIVQVVYPEFRHDIGDKDRAYANWANMILMIAWISVPGSVILGVLSPHLMPILFGPGWEVAAAIAPGLAIASGLQMPGTILSSGLQATNNQYQTWVSEGFVLVVQVWCVVPLILYSNIWFALGGVIAAPVVRHISDIFYATRRGLINLRQLAIGYVWLAVACLCLGVGLHYMLQFVIEGSQSLVLRVALTILVLLVALCLILKLGTRVPPVRIARQYFSSTRRG